MGPKTVFSQCSIRTDCTQGEGLETCIVFLRSYFLLFLLVSPFVIVAIIVFVWDFVKKYIQSRNHSKRTDSGIKNINNLGFGPMT